MTSVWWMNHMYQYYPWEGRKHDKVQNNTLTNVNQRQMELQLYQCFSAGRFQIHKNYLREIHYNHYILVHVNPHGYTFLLVCANLRVFIQSWLRCKKCDRSLSHFQGLHVVACVFETDIFISLFACTGCVVRGNRSESEEKNTTCSVWDSTWL